MTQSDSAVVVVALVVTIRLTANTTKRTACTGVASSAHCSRCGVLKAHLARGTRRTVQSPSGRPGAMTFKATRSMPDTFSRKKLRNRQPTF